MTHESAKPTKIFKSKENKHNLYKANMKVNNIPNNKIEQTNSK